MINKEQIAQVETFLQSKFYKKADSKYYFVHIPILDENITTLVAVYSIDIVNKTCDIYCSHGRIMRDEITNDFYLDELRNILGW